MLLHTKDIVADRPTVAPRHRLRHSSVQRHESRRIALAPLSSSMATACELCDMQHAGSVSSRLCQLEFLVAAVLSVDFDTISVHSARYNASQE